MARELFRRLLPYGQMPQTLLIGGFAGVILVGSMVAMKGILSIKAEAIAETQRTMMMATLKGTAGSILTHSTINCIKLCLLCPGNHDKQGHKKDQSALPEPDPTLSSERPSQSI